MKSSSRFGVIVTFVFLCVMDAVAADDGPQARPNAAGSESGTHGQFGTAETSAPKKVRVDVFVGEGHPDGPVVEAARVEVVGSSPDRAADMRLGSGTTDNSGRVTIDVIQPTQPGSEQYEAVVAYAGQTRRTALERFPRVTEFRIAAPVRPPEPMLQVTLECEPGWQMGLIPMACVGVDAVNAGGTSADSRSKFTSISIECLPGAFLTLNMEQTATTWRELRKEREQAFVVLPILAEDDRKRFVLKRTASGLFVNDRKAVASFARMTDGEREQWIEAYLLGGPNRPAHDAEAVFGKRPDKSGLRLVSVGQSDQHLDLLRCLEGTGVGILLGSAKEDRLGEPLAPSPEFVLAVAKVQPRLLACDAEDVAVFADSADTVETLVISLQRIGQFPDLSLFKRLQCLYVWVASNDPLPVALEPSALPPLLPSLPNPLDDPDSTTDPEMIPFASLSKCKRLRALTIAYEGNLELEHVEPIGSLGALQCFAYWSGRLDDVRFLDQLPRLQHLTIDRPHAELSFVRRMPYLQTLAIREIGPQSDLKPLVEATRLRCLALGVDGKRPKEVQKMPHLQEFQEVRPDVRVVSVFDGVCLGSFWLVPAAVGAAAIACWIRIRRSMAAQAR